LELSPHLRFGRRRIAVRPEAVDDAKDILERYGRLHDQGLVPHYSSEPGTYLEMLWSDASIFEFCKG
ncbi:MAG: hypothetical protein ACOC6F_02405, partial [bacterium]